MARVLVVEDDADLRTLIVRRIERAGHSVDEAATGEGAIRLLREREYDLITLDINLPGISGWQVAYETASNPQTTHVPILVVSLTERDDAPQHGMVRVKGWLAKPFANHALKRSVEELLG